MRHLKENYKYATYLMDRVISLRRMGPFALEGSTICPFCVISILFFATSLRAAWRTCSMMSLFCFKSSVKISEGQMVLPAPRFFSSSIRASSYCGEFFERRHFSLQYFISSQFASHFFLGSMVLPQRLQTFSLRPLVLSATMGFLQPLVSIFKICIVIVCLPLNIKVTIPWVSSNTCEILPVSPIAFDIVIN